MRQFVDKALHSKAVRQQPQRTPPASPQRHVTPVGHRALVGHVVANGRPPVGTEVRPHHRRHEGRQKVKGDVPARLPVLDRHQSPILFHPSRQQMVGQRTKIAVAHFFCARPPHMYRYPCRLRQPCSLDRNFPTCLAPVAPPHIGRKDLDNFFVHADGLGNLAAHKALPLRRTPDPHSVRLHVRQRSLRLQRRVHRQRGAVLGCQGRPIPQPARDIPNFLDHHPVALPHRDQLLQLCLLPAMAFFPSGVDPGHRRLGRSTAFRHNPGKIVGDHDLDHPLHLAGLPGLKGLRQRHKGRRAHHRPIFHPLHPGIHAVDRLPGHLGRDVHARQRLANHAVVLPALEKNRLLRHLPLRPARRNRVKVDAAAGIG